MTSTVSPDDTYQKEMEMPVEKLTIKTSDGEMEATIALPDHRPRRMNVLLFMDAMGVRDELVEFAPRFAAAGYACALPDLYYRWGRNVGFNVSKDYTGLPDEVQEEFYRLVAEMRDDHRVLGDADAVISRVTEMEEKRLPWAAVGYCMGGRFALQLLAAGPDFSLPEWQPIRPRWSPRNRTLLTMT